MKTGGHTPIFATVLLFWLGIGLGAAELKKPYEGTKCVVPVSGIDKLVLERLEAEKVAPANICSDEVFARRVYLDVIGTLPSTAELKQFYANERLDKRSELIEKLLERPEFADYWTMKWCNLLRVKAEFPINLWPNAVQAYYRWILDAVKANMPYDQFARTLLTSSGSNFREPAVNFYRAVSAKEPDTIAAAVALTFMGTRTKHWEEWQRADIAVFFSRISYKATDEWKEQIVCLDPSQYKAFDVVFPDGTGGKVNTCEDPRKVFANWLITPENPWFAKNIVNRAWFWLMGQGIIHEADDIRPDNPASNPVLLAYLEKSFVESGYDMKQLFRIILDSRTYQQSFIPQSKDLKARALFAYYPVRRLDAEVLIDALNWIGNAEENYQSAIPEPFTFVPENQRTIRLADGSVTSPFLEMFGRPSRDMGFESERDNEPSDAQRLFLLNSSQVQSKMANSSHILGLINKNRREPVNVISALYMGMLSRNPTGEEVKIAQSHFWKLSGGKRGNLVIEVFAEVIPKKDKTRPVVNIRCPWVPYRRFPTQL